MIRNTVLWVIYFVLCGTVIAAAISAARNHAHCHECPHAYTSTEK